MGNHPSPNDQSQNESSASVAVGGVTSGQHGATPTHESQEETGGNGGPGLTRNQSGPYVNAPNGVRDGDPAVQGASVEAIDSGAPQRTESVDAAMTHANPGARNTRADQAGMRETGLGTPETGGNQSERDLPPTRP